MDNSIPEDWIHRKISLMEIQRTSQIFSDIKSSGISHNHEIYNSLFKIYSDDAKKVLEIYNFLKKSHANDSFKISIGNIQTIAEIIKKKHSKFKGIDLLGDLTRYKIDSDQKTFLDLLNHENISIIHDRLKWRKVVLLEKWDKSVYGALMKIYAENNCFNAVERLWDELEKDKVPYSRKD